MILCFFLKHRTCHKTYPIMLRSDCSHYVLLIVLGLAIHSMLSDTASAQQNQFKRNLILDKTLQARQLPEELKNKGLVYKGFIYKPSLDVETRYNSNVLAQTNDTTPDFVHALGPGIGVQKEYGLNKFHFNVDLNIERFYSREQENKEEFRVQTRGTIGINSRWLLPYDVFFTRNTLNRTQPRQSNTTKTPTRRRRFNAETGIKRRFNRGSLALIGHFRELSLEDGRAIHTNQPVIKSDSNRTEYGATLNARYLLGPRNERPEYNLFAVLTVNQQDFEKRRFENGAFQGPTSDRTEYIGTLGFETRYKDLVYANLGAGLQRQAFDADGSDSVNAFRFSAELRAKITPGSSLNFRGTRNVNQESELTKGSINTRFGTGLDYELRHDIYFNSNVDYIHRDFIEDQRVDEDFIAKSGIKYFLNDNLTSEISLRYRDRSSNLSGNAFRRTLMLWRITGRL